jgi:hypothetical protein
MVVLMLEHPPLSSSDAVENLPIGIVRRVNQEDAVFILDEDRPEPVFHRWAPMLTSKMPDGGEQGTFTACGRRLTSWSSFAREYNARLRPEHALTFARPCRLCWKGL